MRSIVEEAPSVVKAIEKAWVRAGKPVSFQVKIFEESQKNFLGFTRRSAKIGLFFSEADVPVAKPVRPEPRKPAPRTEVHKQPPVVRPERKRERPEVPRQEPREESRQEPREESRQEPRQERKPRVRWTPDMIKASQEWLDYTLGAMGFGDITYSLEAKGYHLRIFFSAPLFADRSKEQMLFRSFAHLMMQMIRTKFKKGFTGFKVVLKGA